MSDGDMYYAVKGPALELMREYKKELDQLIAGRIALNREFTERIDQLGTNHNKTMRAIWQRMSAMVGLDPETTWGNPAYQVEVRYLKDGFGAITYIRPPDVDGAPQAPSNPRDHIPDDATRH